MPQKQPSQQEQAAAAALHQRMLELQQKVAKLEGWRDGNCSSRVAACPAKNGIISTCHQCSDLSRQAHQENKSFSESEIRNSDVRLINQVLEALEVERQPVLMHFVRPITRYVCILLQVNFNLREFTLEIFWIRGCLPDWLVRGGSLVKMSDGFAYACSRAATPASAASIVCWLVPAKGGHKASFNKFNWQRQRLAKCLLCVLHCTPAPYMDSTACRRNGFIKPAD